MPEASNFGTGSDQSNESSRDQSATNLAAHCRPVVDQPGAQRSLHRVAVLPGLQEVEQVDEGHQAVRLLHPQEEAPAAVRPSRLQHSVLQTNTSCLFLSFLFFKLYPQPQNNI